MSEFSTSKFEDQKNKIYEHTYNMLSDGNYDDDTLLITAIAISADDPFDSNDYYQKKCLLEDVAGKIDAIEAQKVVLHLIEELEKYYIDNQDYLLSATILSEAGRVGVNIPSQSITNFMEDIVYDRQQYNS